FGARADRTEAGPAGPAHGLARSGGGGALAPRRLRGGARPSGAREAVGRVEARRVEVRRVIPAELESRVRDLGREMPGALAVFDADGTLWREDVGEAFLRHLVALGWVRLTDGADPYEAYERAVDRDKASGYVYAAQLQAGLLAARVAAEAEQFARGWIPSRIVSDTKGLRDLCEAAGLTPFVVSASALPIVLAAAPLAGFSRDRCRGIEVRVRDGKFTTEVIEPITYGAGKISA